MPATSTTTRRNTRSSRRTSPALPAPRTPEPAAAQRPTQHNGVDVAREELLSNLPNGKATFRISRLHLADDNVAYACRDCTVTADTRGQIMVHRNDMHGAGVGKKPRTGTARTRPGSDALDLVLAPRPDGSPAPSDPMQMTMGEVLALMPGIAALGDLVERLERERDAALALLEANHIDRSTQHKIDVYEEHREEIIELRLLLNRQANYEQIKEELYALRAWKKKVMTKLSSIGFVINEGEQ